ncbi:GNAT family N-acetyltransferase [Bacillus sp. UMB0899]|nr:GNAT family N-acetyltransferase [Bacillus sp. UMB0899]
MKDNYKIQTIRIQGNDDVVGLLTTYQGYPNPKTMYITYLYINLEFQKQGFGQEVVYELLRILKQNEYDEVRANVAMKNWSALRFWTKLGLNKINGIFGDKEHSSDNYADVELIMEL